MITPGVVGLIMAWSLRRETPAAIGLTFTGWKPWVFAFCFPLMIEAIILAVAYGYRWGSNDPNFISLNTVRIPGDDYQNFRGWWSLLGLTLTFAVAITPYLAIAFLERRRLILTKAGRSSLIGVYLAEAAAWTGVFFINYGALVHFGFRLPGELGEEIGWRGFLVRRWLDRPLIAAMLSMPVWALFHLPVTLLPHQRGHLVQNISMLAANGLMGAINLELYLWARSIWPCVALHLWWNLSNETILGDVYGWTPGLFDGKFWVFNGEGLCGCIVLLPIAAAILFRLKKSEALKSV